jgi:23S rRNA (pseudouridine1915-N3)-methyltransferase
MLSVSVICVGKLKESYWRDACAEYAKRLSPFCRLQIVEVAEERVPNNPSPAQITAAMEAEGERILARVPSGAALITMCIEGKELTSEQLSESLAKWAVDGTSHIAFVIGGSWGLSPAVKTASSLRLSMSPMTFTHQMARVMVLEQLYRAMQIANGGKYHK